jgi:hypothetical protein
VVAEVNERGWKLVVGLALLVRFALVLTTFGTNDMEAWATFAQQLHEHPVCFVYEHVLGMFGQFNHPPLMGYVMGGAWWLGHLLHLPFYVTFKMLVFVADGVTIAVLYRRAADRRSPDAWLAAAVYAWSLDAMLVACFHGNTDSLGILACVLAVYAAERGHFGWAGLALGAAINVKLIPILLLPAFVASLPDWRAAVRFGVGGALAAIPFLPSVVSCPGMLTQKVLRYVPHVDRWGVPYVLAELVPGGGRLVAGYVANARPLLFGLLVLLVLFVRFVGKRPLHELCALSFALFLVLTPGFGVQYTAWVGPFIVMCGLFEGALYGLLSGAFLAIVYLHFADWSKLPILSHLWGRFPDPAPKVGLMAWVFLLAFVIVLLYRSRPRAA